MNCQWSDEPWCDEGDLGDINDDLYAQIEALAVANGRSVSAVVEEALRRYVGDAIALGEVSG